MGFLKTQMVTEENSLKGRAEAIECGESHFVSGRPLKGPYPDGCETVYFALGCYWGAERAFWTLKGVWVTAVGNIAGFTPNPTYEELCTGLTGHAEAVLVVYDPKVISFADLLEVFWQAHDPTQGMRQGGDRGTQYRSGIYTTSDAQMKAALATRDQYQEKLKKAGYGPVTTEIEEAGPFYFAETYHQQYLAKNPNGYCGLGGTGINLCS